MRAAPLLVPIPRFTHVEFLLYEGCYHPRQGLWGTGSHLAAPVTGISLEQPLHGSLGRAGLALEEGCAPGHAVLHRLHGVLIGCGATGCHVEQHRLWADGGLAGGTCSHTPPQTHRQGCALRPPLLEGVARDISSPTPHLHGPWEDLCSGGPVSGSSAGRTDPR